MRQLIISLCLLFSISVAAQDAHLDSLNEKILKYEQRIEKRRNHWKALIPDFNRVQFAGSVGLISLGTGWEYGKHHQWETDVMFGFLPKYSSNDNKITFTIRQTYIPWTIPLNSSWEIQPLSCGLFFNTIFNDQFWVGEPSRYPGGYYGFSSKVRAHIFIGQRYMIYIPKEKRFLSHDISFCWELSTCDLYVVSAVTNDYLKLDDILSLSLGLIFYFD